MPIVGEKPFDTTAGSSINLPPGLHKKSKNEFANLWAEKQERPASSLCRPSVEESAAEIVTWCNSG
jgi:hypothetical protein